MPAFRDVTTTAAPQPRSPLRLGVFAVLDGALPVPERRPGGRQGGSQVPGFVLAPGAPVRAARRALIPRAVAVPGPTAMDA